MDDPYDNFGKRIIIPFAASLSSTVTCLVSNIKVHSAAFTLSYYVVDPQYLRKYDDAISAIFREENVAVNTNDTAGSDTIEVQSMTIDTVTATDYSTLQVSIDGTTQEISYVLLLNSAPSSDLYINIY
jgi:hypothetical protein